MSSKQFNNINSVFFTIIYSQYHELRLIADQGVLLLHQLEPLLHQLGVVLLAHTWTTGAEGEDRATRGQEVTQEVTQTGTETAKPGVPAEECLVEGGTDASVLVGLYMTMNARRVGEEPTVVVYVYTSAECTH